MTERRCDKCEFWGELSKEDLPDGVYFTMATGECRKKAPRIIHGSGTGWSNQKWPYTQYDRWCGEFKEKTNATV